MEFFGCARHSSSDPVLQMVERKMRELPEKKKKEQKCRKISEICISRIDSIPIHHEEVFRNIFTL